MILSEVANTPVSHHTIYAPLCINVFPFTCADSLKRKQTHPERIFQDLRSVSLRGGHMKIHMWRTCIRHVFLIV